MSLLRVSYIQSELTIHVRHLLRFFPPRCRPDRWFDLEADKHAPPLKTWSFMMGPRTCPGWRYAQVQVMW